MTVTGGLEQLAGEGTLKDLQLSTHLASVGLTSTHGHEGGEARICTVEDEIT